MISVGKGLKFHVVKEELPNRTDIPKFVHLGTKEILL